ncbi:sugar-binding transcriptional regulator [Parageobacillus thermoglucosidasius]|uniref:sugar-binding transcriptional regulator n=1 Tax=Parageobacillus thermoglucosidasius TaxID=1426 RepID=UPI0027F51CDF|nr:sugar-binding transcriptional regulator [Parageobacillus thermoglucosidasius]MED4913799.1 sugar-binding transcriptional regulator [Parageobacillus thermoglucosidasius]MED4946132.1 sugar-binding transcriptional regulator [Parageobacillus thermoglucosidasius]MED4984009.1 sugar-binding transcriptional regulator [Parageobacillus thermoglucosidasius]GMO01237.1 sugar-binding transcriptional regulator [Parageobacillus thermoglucosidasius]
MDKDMYNENLLVKVAWYYYKENLTQQEISEILGLSRNKVVRLLEKARLEGIVQFHIKGYGTNCLSIEKDLKETFSLSNAFVVPTPADKSTLNTTLAKAAAQYLQNKLQKKDLIGFGWGRTVSYTIEHLSIEEDSELSAVTLTGGVNYYFPNTTLSNRGLSKFKNIHVIPTPFLASTEEMASKFLNEPTVKEILDLAMLSKYAVVGIGATSLDATIVLEEKLTISELTYIRQQNAVGDILGQFFNRDGEILDLPHHSRLIGIKLPVLKKMNNVIAVAGGEKKVEAIYGALKGKYVNMLITDELTAISLLKMEEESKK